MNYLRILLVVLLLSCRSGFDYPEGGYNYPINLTGNDTNYYSYPLLAISPKSDRFSGYFQHLFYQPFEEPNLSIRPLAKETFRLTYSQGMGETIILSFNEEEITIKKVIPGGLYDQDTSKLTKLESAHFRILERWFPFETKGNIPGLKKHLDSLSLLYPELLDVNYFLMLYDKVKVRNKEKFIYQSKKNAITKKAFSSIVEQINASGYWQLPYIVECEPTSTHGPNFTLEANTFKKYQIVNRGVCRGHESGFLDLCQKIIAFAGLDKEIIIDTNWEPVLVKPDSSHF